MQNKMYRYLVVLTVASTIGLESWLTLFNNFAVEVVALEGNQIGLIQSVREIPGFLSLLVVFALLVFKEYRLSALAIIILGLGMAVTGLLPSFSGLIFSTLIMILYILDQVFYNFHIAIQTYFQKIGNPKDIAVSISVSFTINHIAAVILPAIGGMLWMIDYRIPFIGGAIFSFVSLIAVQKIPIRFEQRIA